jgi:hypothetical protein
VCASRSSVDRQQLRGRLSQTSNDNSTHIQKMKTSIHTFQILLAAAIAILGIALPAHAANLSDRDKQFLAGYEKVHTALVADDLSGAKSAAKGLGDEGSEVATAGSLKDARASFEKLSDRAKTLVAGQSVITSSIAQCSRRIGCKAQ